MLDAERQSVAASNAIVRLRSSQFLQTLHFGRQLRRLAKAEVSAGRCKAPCVEGTGESRIKLQTRSVKRFWRLRAG